MRLLSTTIAAAVVAAFAALPAQATICRHQPGQGAIDQYCEIIPSGGGDRPDRTGGGSSSLPSQTGNALRAAGAEGTAVAALAKTSPAPQLNGDDETGPSGGEPATGEGTTSGTSQSSGKSGSSEPAPTSSGTLQAVVGDLGGTGGRGWLPWALLAIAVSAGFATWLRRGRSS